ncbi:MAG: alpha/beta fold hydrolase [Ignisphaera sp.]
MPCVERPLTFPSGGFDLSAYIHIASVGTSHMVLMLHGFTGNKIEVNRLFVDIARALCRNGVSVFRFDYRGHGESPLDFEEFRFEYALEDSENALKYVREMYKPRKLFLIGLSMGGHIATRLAAFHSNEVSGAILLSPALNFVELGRGLKSFAQKVGGYYILGPNRLSEEGVESLLRYNALELADRIKIPILIIHAKEDQIVPYTQSQQLFEKLLHKDKKLILLDSGGHVFSTYESKTRVIEEIVNWIKQRI